MENSVNKEDIPDEFVDDFTNIDFIEGFDVIDSWEPPITGTIVIDDSDKEGHPDVNPKVNQRKWRCDSRSDKRRSVGHHSRRTSKSPRTEEKSHSRITPSYSKRESPLHRRRSRDSPRRSRRSRSRDFQPKVRSRFRSRSKSRNRDIDNGRKAKESNEFRTRDARHLRTSNNDFRMRNGIPIRDTNNDFQRSTIMSSSHIKLDPKNSSMPHEKRIENKEQRTHTKVQELYASKPIGVCTDTSKLVQSAHYYQYPDQKLLANNGGFMNYATPYLSNTSGQNMQHGTNFQTAPDKVSFSENKNLPMKNINVVSTGRITAFESQNKRHLVFKQLDIIFSKLPDVRFATSISDHLFKLLNIVRDAIKAIIRLGQSMINWDCILIFHISKHMDTETQLQWDALIGDTVEVPKFRTFVDFLVSRIKFLKNLDGQHFGTQFPNKYTRLTQQINDKTKKTKKSICHCCRGEHFIARCQKFHTMSPKKRLEFIQSKSLCLNCLGSHTIGDCKVVIGCKFCDKRHHSALHIILYR